MMYSKIACSQFTQHKLRYNLSRRCGRSSHISTVLAVIVLLLLFSAYRGQIGGALHRWPKLGTERSDSRGIFAVQGSGLIPNNIWQIFLPKHHESGQQTIDPESLADTASWLALNPDFQYTLVGQQGADHFVDHYFADEPAVVETYHNITNVGQKSDLSRYLILYIEGGVYTDTDTVALHPIKDWVPQNMRDQVELIVGIEFDRRDGGPWADIPHWLQFCQWTIAAAPGHPVFRRMISHIIQSVTELEKKDGASDGTAHPTSFEVMTSTGPAAWTDAVFAQLQEFDHTLNDTSDLSFMTEPTLYGNILVLTIDGFGMGQPHSHSTNDGSTPEAALMRHKFRGSWRGN